jgi:hypothetical protein
MKEEWYIWLPRSTEQPIPLPCDPENPAQLKARSQSQVGGQDSCGFGERQENSSLTSSRRLGFVKSCWGWHTAPSVLPHPVKLDRDADHSPVNKVTHASTICFLLFV